ncbi:Uu.00g027630.m01.CDS01 [Anthostomella pinea]|uniref:Uu.00g027630.m01.CDS01 n=1 Tax=Anthostomella pinea TaxID=933095 RepID=A0AAI8V7S5_9PEZI|nr:Uu.00g027630.m01.CDS01 [Anthostomella pinea]
MTTPTETFRFMDLPTEVRDNIYHIILCSWPAPKSTWDEARKLAVVPDEPAVMHHRIHTGILLANCQIHRDATDVLLKGNLFVKVQMRASTNVRAVLVPKQVPIVSMTPSVVAAFKGYALTHSINMDADLLFPVAHLMILHRDLDLFCQAVSGDYIQACGPNPQHCITIHNPWETTSTPNYMKNIKNQERLLQPYREYLRGARSFKFQGNVVKPELARVVANEVKGEPIPDAEELLSDLLRQKALGKQYFDNRDSVNASEMWAKAAMHVFRMTSWNAWPRLIADAGRDLANNITEVYFQLNANLAANNLRVMQETAATDVELAGQYAGAVYSALEKASQASRKLGTDWQPSPDQEAKLCYRLAVAHRIADDNIDVAEQVINHAARHLPNDRAIQQEVQAIARWKARRG